MGGKLQTIKDIRPFIIRELDNLYDEQETNALASTIIRTIIRVPGLHLFINQQQELNETQISEIQNICNELRTGKPYQYITGETEFYRCIIRVSPAVLIPRPETEELVDMIISENKGFTGRVVDIATGSGCIAIALARSLPGATIIATDNSEAALLVARENALLNDVKVSFIPEDIFKMPPDVQKAGIIVSNPPYVRESEKKQMHRNVLDFEPASALFVSDSDPLVYYRAILGYARQSLVKGGRIYFEINEAMGKEVYDLMASEKYTELTLSLDLRGRERFIKGVKND